MAHGSPTKDSQIIQKLDTALGANGSEIVSDTVATNGLFSAVQCVTDVTLTTLTGMTGTVTGITYPAGLVIHGEFTVVTLATGTAILYSK